MSETRMNRKEYERLIEEDIKWLRENTKPRLERDHIINVLRDSINMYYGKPEKKDVEINKANLKNYHGISIQSRQHI